MPLASNAVFPGHVVVDDGGAIPEGGVISFASPEASTVLCFTGSSQSFFNASRHV